MPVKGNLQLLRWDELRSWSSLYSFVSTMSYMSGGGELAHRLALLPHSRKVLGLIPSWGLFACLHVVPVPAWVFPPPYKNLELVPERHTMAARCSSGMAEMQRRDFSLYSLFLSMTAWPFHQFLLAPLHFFPIKNVYEFQPDYASCEYSIFSVGEIECWSVVQVYSGSSTPVNMCANRFMRLRRCISQSWWL